MHVSPIQLQLWLAAGSPAARPSTRESHAGDERDGVRSLSKPDEAVHEPRFLCSRRSLWSQWRCMGSPALLVLAFSLRPLPATMALHGTEASRGGVPGLPLRSTSTRWIPSGGRRHAYDDQDGEHETVGWRRRKTVDGRIEIRWWPWWSGNIWSRDGPSSCQCQVQVLGAVGWRWFQRLAAVHAFFTWTRGVSPYWNFIKTKVQIEFHKYNSGDKERKKERKWEKLHKLSSHNCNCVLKSCW